MLVKIHLGSIFLALIWMVGATIAAEDQSYQIFFTDTTPGKPEETNVILQPTKGINFSQGFSICFKVKFNTWNIYTPFTNSKVEFIFAKLLDAAAYFSVNGIYYFFWWPDGVQQSPYMWYDFCLSYRTHRSFILLTINGVQAFEHFDSEQQNETIAIDGPIYFGQGTASFVFSGWFTDINVWSRPLQLNEIKKFSVCEDFLPGPDVINWKSPNLNLTVGSQVARVKTNRVELCVNNTETNFVSLYVISNLKEYKDAIGNCQGLGGSMPLPRNAIEMDQLYQIVRHENNHALCKEGYWIPVVQSPTNYSRWIVDDKRDTEPPYLPWLKGQPNGERLQKCTKTTSNHNFYLQDVECDYLLCTLCQLNTRSFLRLRGMCNYQNLIDGDYTLRVDLLKNDIYEFQGFTGLSKISFNTSFARWQIMTIWPNTKMIASSVKQVGFPTGLTKWIIDDNVCKSNSPLDLTFLKLTKCSSNQFTCGDGSCVSIILRCDATMDCEDGSDEQNCQQIVIDNDNYQKFTPPNSVNSKLINIGMNITIAAIDNFNDNSMSYKMKFSMALRWYDNRLSFQNLKFEGNSSNVVSEKDIQSIWKPQIIFPNSVKASMVLYDEYSFIRVRRDGYPTPSGLSSLHENEVFSGSENPILYYRTYQLDLDCRFELKPYPFDFQFCTLEVALSDNIIMETSLTLEFFNYTGELDLNQFQVLDSCKYESNSTSLITIEIRLQRLFSYHLTNTFMPTASLLALSEITLFFDENNHDLAMGFSLTTLLVVYTMYQSISTSSPKTEYLKLIDIWIIYCLLMPLAIFMIEVFWKFKQTDSTRESKKTGCCPCGSDLLTRKKLPLLVVASTIMFSIGYIIRIIYSVYVIDNSCG